MRGACVAGKWPGKIVGAKRPRIYIASLAGLGQRSAISSILWGIVPSIIAIYIVIPSPPSYRRLPVIRNNPRIHNGGRIAALRRPVVVLAVTLP